MSANTTTYWGDVLTIGNTTINQSLTVQGAQSIFIGNVGSTQNASGFQSFFGSNANVTTMNTLAIFGTTGQIGVGTSTNLGATLQVLGNAFGSNALSAPNVFASTFANILALNTASIFASSGPGLVGIGTSTNLGANLHVLGNVFALNAFATPNVFASTFANIQALNTASIFATSGPGRVGIGTSTNLGANLHVIGNVWASNALQTQNVFAAISANISALNTPSIFASSGPGRVGIGTSTNLGANLHVAGNVWASNAFQTTNVYSNLANIATLNVSQIWRTFGNSVGIGTSTNLGANVQLDGNLWASNALQTPNIFALTSANIQALNTASIFATSGPGRVGIGTSTNLGGNLHVAGNLFVSNGLQLGLVTANIMNVATVNVAQIWRTAGNSVGIGTSTNLGANLQVEGNVWASNALQTPVVIASTSANVVVINTFAVYARTGATLGIGTSAALGANLHVLGNVWASNSMTGALQFTDATFNQAVYLAGTPRIFTPGSQLGIGTATNLGASLQIQGNVFGSNALQTPNVFALVSANVPVINTASFASGLAINTASPGGWTLNVSGDLVASNTINAAFGPVTTLNVPTINVTTISNLNPILNLYVSNSISNPVWANLANTLLMNSSSINANVGFGTAWTSGGPTLTLAAGANIFAANSASGVFAGVLQANVSQILNTNFVNANVGFGTAYASGGPTVALPVDANLFGANSITSNFRGVLQANVSQVLNTNFINANVGIGTAWVSGGPTVALPLGANLFAANSITSSFASLIQANTTTLNVTSIGFTGGLLQPIQGNVYVSNSLSVTNVYASQTLNTALANVTAVYAPSFSVGVGTSTNLGANLQVQGNIWVSNLTGAYLAIDNATANFTTLNTTTIWSQSNPAAVPSSWSVGRDVIVPSTTGAPDVYVSGGGLRYTNDPANVFVRNQLTLLRTSTCVYGNVVNGPRGQPDYRGSAFLGDGRVVFAPWSASNVGVFSPSLSTFSAITPPGLSAEPSKFSGVVLEPAGNVVFVPSGISNVGIWNPVNRLYSNVIISASGFEGGVLAPTGNIVFVPGPGTANVGLFDPRNYGFTNIAAAPGYSGAVLAPDGNVVLVPNTAPNVGIFDPVTRIFSLGPSATPGGFTGGVLAAPKGNVVFVPGPLASGPGLLSADFTTLTQIPGPSGFSGGVLLPTGNVLCVPLTSANIGLFDPDAQTFSNATDCPGGFSGGSLLPDGRVVMSPWTSMNVGVVQTLAPSTKEFCILPYFNHC